MPSAGVTRMSFPLKGWFSRRRRRIGGSEPHEVEHLRAGHKLSADSNPANPVSLVLKGRCETPQELAAGDSIDAEPADVPRSPIRAIADSALLRLPREALRRLTQRWQDPKGSGSKFSRLDAMTLGGTEARTVVCLMPLSEGVPSEDIALGIGGTIFRETGEPVLRILVNGSDAEDPADRSPASVPGHEGLFRQNASGDNDGRSLRRLVRVLDEAHDRFAHILVEVAETATVEAFRIVLSRSGAIYPILRQEAESLFELHLLVREVHDCDLESVPIKPLVYLEAEENAHGLSLYIEETIKRPVHFYLREAMADELRWRANLRRLGREICGRQVGLALSSGAARGLSHIGVIQVLEENGIEVDVVAGSSMGAYVAAAWGAGHGGQELEGFARELEGYRGQWRLLDLSLYPRRGFLLTNRVRKRLEETIGPVHFSDMARPIRVVATRLDTLERKVFAGGSVVDAVLASIAIPGICVPVTLDGISYTDGGICDPLPVDVLTEMGINKIIAVNTIATPDVLRCCKDEMVRDDRGVLRKLNELFNFFAPGNAFDTMMRSIHAAQTRLAESSCKRANIVLRPYSCGSRWYDFGNPSRYIPLGREAAEAQMPTIRALIDSPLHENETSHRVMAQAA